MALRKKRDGLTRNKERASISFFIVIIFFALFGIIILFELLLMDDHNYEGHLLIRRSEYGVKKNKFDYEDNVQVDDLIRYSNDLRDDFHQEAVNKLFQDTLFLKNEMHKQKEDALVMTVERGIPVIADKEISHSIGVQPLPYHVESQLPPIDNTLPVKDGEWQNVNGTKNKFFIFSAFYDQRKSQRIIRVIGATKTRSTEKVWCRISYKAINQSLLHLFDPKLVNDSTFSQNRTITLTVLAKIKVIRENWNLKYSACFVLCPLVRTPDIDPYTVSVVSKLKMIPTNRLLVRNTNAELENVRKQEDGIAVCVKPLHFYYDQVINILEFLNLNKLLGIRHFTFYKHTIGERVNCILDHYAKDPGFFSANVTTLPWNLQMVSQKEIRTEGLFSALNDCLYRNMYRYAYVVMIDLDEFIVPKHNLTILELIKWIGTRMNTKNTGSYSFQNGFFYLQWEDDETVYSSDDQVEAALITVRKTRRRSKLHPHKQRSKYVCKPEKVIEAGNHFVWEFLPGYGTLNVPADAGILNHYRVCEFGGDDCIKTSSIVDKTAYKYKNALSSLVRANYDILKDKCHLGELPPIPVKKTAPKKKEAKIINKRMLEKKPIFQKYMQFFLKS